MWFHLNQFRDPWKVLYILTSERMFVTRWWVSLKRKKSRTRFWRAAPSILSPLYTKPPFLLNWTPLSNNIPPCLELQVFHQPPPPTNKPHAPPLKNFFVVVLSRIVRLESPSQPLCWMSCNTWGSVTWDRKEWLIPPKKGDMWPSSCRLSKFN